MYRSLKGEMLVLNIAAVLAAMSYRRASSSSGGGGGGGKGDTLRKPLLLAVSSISAIEPNLIPSPGTHPASWPSRLAAVPGALRPVASAGALCTSPQVHAAEPEIKQQGLGGLNSLQLQVYFRDGKPALSQDLASEPAQSGAAPSLRRPWLPEGRRKVLRRRLAPADGARNFALPLVQAAHKTIMPWSASDRPVINPFPLHSMWQGRLPARLGGSGQLRHQHQWQLQPLRRHSRECADLSAGTPRRNVCTAGRSRP